MKFTGFGNASNFGKLLKLLTSFIAWGRCSVWNLSAQQRLQSIGRQRNPVTRSSLGTEYALGGQCGRRLGNTKSGKENREVSKNTGSASGASSVNQWDFLICMERASCNTAVDLQAGHGWCDSGHTSGIAWFISKQSGHLKNPWTILTFLSCYREMVNKACFQT